MAEKKSIALGAIIDRFHLEVLYGPDNYRDRKISIEHVDRPGLQLTGYFDYFDRERIQLIGLVETSYLKGLTEEEREIFDKENPYWVEFFGDRVSNGR